MPKRTVLAFAFTALVLVAFTLCDYLLLDDLIPNRGPHGTAYDLVKAVVAAGLSFAIVAGILADDRGAGGHLAPDVAASGPVIFNFILAAFFVVLFIASPSAFHWLSLEDNAVEYLSALYCLAGSVFFLGVILAARRSAQDGAKRRVTLLVASLGALTLFLIGMEEVSWFQRILGFGTPESFSANLQGEVNLHNFLTTPVHTVYRLGSWAVLVLLPFMVAFGHRGQLAALFDDLLPPPWIAAMSAPVACFNYNAWPFLPTQVVAFSSLMIMLIFWRRAQGAGQRESAWMFGVAAALIVVAQSVFLVGGERFVRHWDVTEFQEYFMAFGLAVFAWSVRERVRTRGSLPEGKLAVGGARHRF